MALPSTGSISLRQVNVELGKAAGALIRMGDAAVRALAGRTSGSISMSHLRGKSAFRWVVSASSLNSNISNSGSGSVVAIAWVEIRGNQWRDSNGQSGALYSSSSGKTVYYRLSSRTGTGWYNTTGVTSTYRALSSSTWTRFAVRTVSSRGTRSVTGNATLVLATSSGGANAQSFAFRLVATANSTSGGGIIPQ